jgi:uncharacterized protein YjbJ (UPF0337 family)
MKALPWLLAIVGVGAAAYVVLNTPGPEYATGSDSIEGAARDTSTWGSKKQAIGKATGNADLADEGVFDQVAGSVKDAAGSVAQAAGQTLHEFNR